MHISLDSAVGRQPLLGNVGEKLLPAFPGAAAAYSLRALNGNGDPVVRVRRDSDNDERDFTAFDVTSGELVNWVTEESATANGFVETWYDQAGSNDAEQTTITKQPQIVGEVTSGQPHALLGGLEFDGSDDHFDLTSSTLTDGFQLFSVLSVNGTSDEKAIIASNIAKNYIRIQPNNNSISSDLGSNLKTNSFNNPSSLTQNEDYLISFLRNDSNSLIVSINGTAQNDQETSAGNNLQYQNIGIRQFTLDPYNGKMQELVIYNSDQSSNQSRIESNINDHYDIY